MIENGLRQILAERIRERGNITFAEYMSACLYEPELGYYTSPGRKVGAQGDFFTSITVHAAFGRVIAREIAAAWHSMGKPSCFTVVEAGAGHGRLACDIMDFLSERDPECYDSTSLVLIEKEPTLAEAQMETLKGHAGKLTQLPPEALGGKLRITGVIYSNELMDAMPVQRVIMTDGGLREISVAMAGEEFIEQLIPPSTPAIEDYLARFASPLIPGQEAEVSLAGLSWFDSALNSLERGFIITIDYGYLKDELYSPHRQHGTLLCYHQHKVEYNPYVRQGEQDITSHVNFSALIERGKEGGLRQLFYGDQCRFLLSAGILEEFDAIEASELSEQQKLKARLTMKRLIMPEGGMGDTFKVLVQSKGVDSPNLGCMRGI